MLLDYDYTIVDATRISTHLAAQLEKAVDMAQESQAMFTNFDSSVYTIIFIPTDEVGVLPPGAEKYLKQVIQRHPGGVSGCFKMLKFIIFHVWL